MEAGRLELLIRLMALEFAAIELTLFLDTHPTCQEALNDYNRIGRELYEVKEVYQQHYGPLIAYGMEPAKNGWQYIEEPWPWQISHSY